MSGPSPDQRLRDAVQRLAGRDQQTLARDRGFVASAHFALERQYPSLPILERVAVSVHQVEMRAVDQRLFAIVTDMFGKLVGIWSGPSDRYPVVEMELARPAVIVEAIGH